MTQISEEPGGVGDGGNAGESTVDEDGEEREAADVNGEAADEAIVVGDPIAHKISLGSWAFVRRGRR